MASFHRSGFYGTVQSQGAEKHAVILDHTGTDGLALVQTPGFNVMVLDIMLEWSKYLNSPRIRNLR